MENILTIINIFVLIATLIISLVENIIVLKQLLYLRKQIRVESASSTSTAYLNVFLLNEQITDVFLEHPEIKKYFYENAEICKNDSKYPLVETVAEKILDVLEQMLWQRSNFPQIYGENNKSNDFHYLSWEDYINFLFKNSPILVNFALEKRWHSNQLLIYAKKYCDGKF